MRVRRALSLVALAVVATTIARRAERRYHAALPQTTGWTPTRGTTSHGAVPSERDVVAGRS